MLNDLLARNLAWSEQRHAEKPDHFTRLAALQAPEVFCIGCSDSRVPANVIAGLDPGGVLVHRNVANIVHSSDRNLLSALAFAVDALCVRVGQIDRGANARRIVSFLSELETRARNRGPAMKHLIRRNHPPYGTGRSFNGLRMARALARNDDVAAITPAARGA